MIARSSLGPVAMLALAIALFGGPQASAFQPNSFTFTPTFKDPDPGRRQWEKTGNGYVEKLPSGRVNNFKLEKESHVHGLAGVVLRKVEEPNFFVFIADSQAARPELYWWRDKGPWNFMGVMKDVRAPQNLD